MYNKYFLRIFTILFLLVYIVLPLAHIIIEHQYEPHTYHDNKEYFQSSQTPFKNSHHHHHDCHNCPICNFFVNNAKSTSSIELKNEFIDLYVIIYTIDLNYKPNIKYRKYLFKKLRAPPFLLFI